MTSLVTGCPPPRKELGTPLREQVIAAIQDRWVRPEPTPRERYVLAEDKDKTEKLARKTLDTMLTRRFRVTRLPSEEEYNELLVNVRHWVRLGRPVKIMLGYAPMKNPNSVQHTHCDWGEFFALCHLALWHSKVCTAYPPGLQIKIIFDDSTVRMANRYAKEPMNDYITSVGRLIKAMKYESFIVGTMRQSSFAWLFHFGVYWWARRRVRRWEQDPANRETFDQMHEFSRRNLQLPDGLREEERERCFRDAAHRYRVYWEALQLSGFSKLGNKLIAMYMDGHQHHIRQQAALHLASVGKEQVTQPWQGPGTLWDNGRGKLVPLVLTGSRREKLTAEEVTGLHVISMDGFGKIAVCRDK